MCGDALEVIGMLIHFRNNIIRSSGRTDYTLIMNGDIRKRFEHFIAFILILPAARFVAEAPHRNAGVILVPFKHTQNPVPISGKPLCVIAENIRFHRRLTFKRTLCAVGFDIRFVNHIQSVFVAKVKKNRIRRIMRGSDGVDVERFHQSNVLEKILCAHHIAVLFMCIMMIDTLEFDKLIIEQEPFPVNFHRSEANPCTDNLNNLILIRKRQKKLIKYGLFGAPFLYRKIAERKADLFSGIDRLGSNAFFVLHQLCTDTQASGVFNVQTDFGFKVVAVFGLSCIHRKVVDIVLAVLGNIHVTENSVFTEHILTFQIRAVTPFCHNCQKLVFAGNGKAVKRKLRHIVRAFAVTDIPAVNIKRNA